VNRLSRIELAFAAGAISLGLYLLIGSSGINLGTGYDRIGPRFFPYLIAAGLLVSSGAMVFEVLGRSRPAQTLSIDPLSFSILILALVICVLLLERLGFILAVTVLFTLVARAFKSRRSIRDALVGLILSISVYYIFTAGLGLVLPRGVLSGLT
jgi:putative tricarboxylic transport membrane protein